MMSHEEWFSYLDKPEQPGVAETGDDTPHTILSHVGQERKLMNVVDIPTVAKNMVSVGQIVN